MGLSLRKIGNSIRDVFDANTQSDQNKRIAQGQARMYEDTKMSNFGKVNSIGQSIVKPFVSLGKVGVEYNRAALAKGSQNTDAYNAARSRLDQNLNDSFILGGASRLVNNAVGSVSSRNQDALDRKLAESIAQNNITASNALRRSQNPQRVVNNYNASDRDNLSRIDLDAQMRGRGASNLSGVAAAAETGLDIGSLGLGGIAKSSAKPLVRTAGRIIGTGLQGGIGNVASSYNKDPNFDITNAGQTAKNFGVGFGTGVVAGEGMRFVNNAVVKASPTLDKAANATAKALESPTKRIDDLILQNQKAFDVETNPTRRRQISQGIANLTAERRALSEGGYIKNPLANDAPQGKTSRPAIPDVKDVNGVKVEEGDTIEFASAMGDKMGRSKVAWVEGSMKNDGTMGEGAWVGNGSLDNGLPFRIVSDKSSAPQVGKTDKPFVVTSQSKPKVTLKNEAPTKSPTPRVSSIDPTDPFGNKNIIKKVRNELGNLVDDDAQMLSMLRKIEKDTGQKGLVDQWYFDSGNVRQSTSIANAKLKNSADLDTALSGLSKKDLDGLDAYTAARAELKNYDGMKTSKNSDDLAKIVAEGDAQYGERFGALNSYYKNMAQDMKDAGLIDESTLKKYLESDDYVRIQRDMEELVNGQYGGSGSRSIRSTSAKQKRTGSTREVVAPTKSLLKRTQQIELEIQRNKASTNIINVLEENGLATRVKDSKSKNVVSRIVDGKSETFEVPGDIKKVIENVNPYQLGIIARIVSTPSRLLRAGTTALSAPFALTNYARDQASSAMVSKSMRSTHKPTAILSGLGSAIRDTVDESHSPLWKKFEAFAGDSTVFDELRNAKSSDRMLRELTQGRVGKYKNMVTAPVRTLEDLNGITEKATRFQNFKGMYEKVLKETNDEQKAVQQAVLAARQNSVDFGRNSSFTRVMNLVFPYFNASVQGSRTVARSFRDRPVAMGLKTAVMGSAVLGITAYNMLDEKRREVYNSINDFEKEDNFIIVGPDAVQTDSGSWEGVYKIPKPQGFRELVDPISDMAQAYFNGESVENTTTMLTDMLSAFTGPIDTSSQTAFIGSLTPQAIKPSVELAMNKSLYTGKDIVPQFMKDGTDDPTKRAFKSTSGSAQWIADQLGVSPIQVEAFIKGTGGSLGLYGLNASDNILAKTGKISEENIGGRSAIGDIKRRTLEASGQKLEKNKSAGQKYFEGVNIVKEPLRGGDKAAFDTLHQSKTNFLGEEIFDENKRITKYTRAGIYLNNPNVLDADVKLDAIQRQNGNPGNPLFDLPKPLLTKVLLKDALPPGAKDPELSNLYKEEWYQDYQNERSKWYEGIKGKLEADGKTMPKSTNPYPTTPKPLQTAMDAYSALPKGTGERSGWIRSNPGLWQQMTAQWAQVDAWENNERVAIGLAPVVEDPNATSKYGSGGGKKSDPSLNPLKYAVSTKSTAKGPTINLKSSKAGRRVTLKAPTGAPKVTTKKSLV